MAKTRYSSIAAVARKNRLQSRVIKLVQLYFLALRLNLDSHLMANHIPIPVGIP